MIALAAMATAAALALDCTVAPPRSVHVEGDAVSSRKIGLPPELNNWRFSVAINATGGEFKATLDWPGDPIQVGQVVAAIPIGPHDFTLVSIHGGPCLFTVSACMFMYTLSEQADGTANILIQPAALTTSGDRSKPFQVFMTGRCTRKNKS